MKKTRRLLAMLLALVMVLSGSAAAFATGGTDGEGPTDNGSTNVTDIDPGTLNVKKLGDKIDLDVSDAEEKTEKYAPDDIVRVSIVLDKKSTIDAGYSVKNYSENKSAQSYRESLKTQQAAVAQEISRRLGKTLDVKWNLTLAVNIISANVQYKDIAAIKMVLGVKDVFIEKQFKVQEVEAGTDTANTSDYMVGATQTWAEGYTGAGQLVAIIDTGIDYTHQAFNEGAFLYSIAEYNAEHETPADLLEESEIPATGLNGEGIYVSAKIPYAYNYKDKSNALADLGHENDQQSNHGSHVAGIAAANRYIPDGSGNYIDAAENTYAVGMAPDAQLVVMKVFGAAGGPYESDYFPAIEDALVLGCSAVNLSLGSDAEGWTFSSTYQETLNFLSSDSIETILSISAGNSGNFTYYQNYPYMYADNVRTNTVGSPGSYINSFTVAAAINTGRTGLYLEFDETSKAFYMDTANDDTSFAAMSTIPGTYNYVYIDALGNAEDYETVNAVESLAGKIVIVNRGEINFSDKGNNALPYSPKAVIVANNQSGLLGMSLSDFTGTCPMVLITLDSALEIKASGTAHTAGNITYYTGSVMVSSDIYSGQITKSAEMAQFSAWGGAGSLVLKPDITAPGGYIYSVNGTSAASSDYNTGPTSYVNYSGTSMAAPHITGLTAVLSQYLDENDIASRNAELATKYSKRAIMQSILMSTAEPMFDPQTFTYYPVMQQGAGLVNVNKAVNAKSVIMMGQKDFTLGAVTGSAADGKVKAELGDDLFANEDGSREFSFTVYNIYDEDQEYILEAAMFVQDWLGYDDLNNMIMAESTIDVDWDVDFDFDGATAGEHDVNADGKTDRKDAQAITDFITGILSANDINAAVADLDGDGEITSYDAYLLLNYADEHPNTLVVPAGESKDVTVTITPNAADVAYLYRFFPNGFYLEGYIYIASTIETADGGYMDDMHTIPVYGFIGNWTDPSMFDENTLIDAMYGYYKAMLDEDDNISFWNYSGRLSNYISLTYNGVASEFYGNPYALEDDIPYERFAVNSRSVIKGIYYNVLRSGATTGYAVLNLSNGSPEVIEAYVDEGYVNGLWFNENTGKWEETDTRMYRVDKSPRQLGLEEGDKFRIGYYSMPEYYGVLYNMLVNMSTGDESPINGPYDGLVDTDAAFQALLEAQFFGKGAYVGYDFTIDDTAPVIDKTSVVFNADDNTLTFSAKDNLNIAYVSIMTIDGETEFWTYVPADDEYEETVDISDAVAEVDGYVALFVADYAGNETAVAVQVNDNVTVDPEAVASVTVAPGAVDVYKNGKAQLVVSVSPITADQSVIWKSADENIATVDEFGEVTGTGAGTTTITVCSVKDETKYAECEVHVLAPSAKLNALLMDEDSKTFFVDFGASDVQDWARKHEDPLEVNLLNALNTSSGIIASTVSSQSSILYSVDPETFTATEIGENYFPAFDMAPYVFQGYDNWLFVYPYAYVLVVGDLEDGGGYGMEYFDEYIGDAWIAAIAAKSLGNGEAEYFFMDDFGKLWTVSLQYSRHFIFSEPELIADTGIEASFLYQNLYFDGTYLYWSYYNGNTSHLVVFDSTDDYKMYEAGDFGKNIWPATGFYMDGQIGAGISTQSASEPLEQMSLEPSEEVKTLFANEELKAEVAAAIDKAEREMKAAAENAEPADQTDGGVNAIGVSAEPRKTSARDFFADQTAPVGTAVRRNGELIVSVKNTDPEIIDFEPGEYFDVIICEEEIVTNGKYEVHYDPTKLVYNDQWSNVYGTPATVGSINDDGNGTVTIAFADNYGIEPGTVIAYVSFDTEESIDLSATIDTTECNDELDLEEEIIVATPSYVMSTSASLPGALHFNTYAVPNAILLADEDAYFVFNYINAKSRTNPVLEEENILIKDAEDNVNGNITRKHLKNTFFIAQLHDEIKVKLYSGNDELQPLLMKNGGEYVSVDGEFVTTVWDYLEGRIANSTNPKMVAIAKAVENYGTSAQIYFKYNADAVTDAARAALMEAVSDEDIVSKMAAYEAQESGTIPSGITKISSTLTVEADHTFKYYFYLEEGADISNYTFMIDGKAVDATYENSNGGRYSIQIPGIPSGELSDTHTFSVSDGTNTRVINASALSYAYGRVMNSSNEDMKVLAKALYLYSMAADNYFSSGN